MIRSAWGGCALCVFVCVLVVVFAYVLPVASAFFIP